MSKARFMVALAAALVPLAAHAVETLLWKRLPLPVELRVGEERVLFTEREMRVGVPANLKGRLRAQSANGAVYLRALMPLQGVRLQLHDAASGELVMLDVTATDPEGDPPLEPLRIEMGISARQAAPQKSGETAPPAAKRGTPVPILLTRYASQNIYAPLRAIEPVVGIRRVAVVEGLDLSTLMPSLPVACRVLAAWKMEESVVTAVLVRNTSPHSIQLDPRQLQGEFVTATFQHPFLGPSGEATDTTALYLVTHRRGLAESLLPASHRIEWGAPGGPPDEK
jgi:integrating conjugative element protein (TIGR03749 family)